MRNFLLRILFAVAVFILTVILLEKVDTQTPSESAVEMEAATLPFITMNISGGELNELRGYTSARDLQLFRPVYTPVGTDRRVSVWIDPFEEQVTDFRYEVRDVAEDRLIENNQAELTQDNRKEGKLTASFVLKDLLEEDTEYLLVMILSTTRRQEIRYYTRFRMTDQDYANALEFVNNFHRGTLSKNGELLQYLETDRSEDTESLQKVTIHSSYDRVTWKKLEVSELQTPVPTLKEDWDGDLIFSMEYRVCIEESEPGADTGDPSEEEDGPGWYDCTEYYRIREGSERYYLIDYERTTDSAPDPVGEIYGDDLISLSIADTGLDYMESSGGAFAFVNGRRLYTCVPADNSVAYVFGFADYDSTDRRENSGEHSIRILKVDETGNTDFLVYGYMNRGSHEGEVGTILYHYNNIYRTIEEELFIPYDGSYELLKLQIEKVAYLNNAGQLFLLQGDQLYCYDLETGKLSVEADRLLSGNYRVASDGSVISYEEENRIIMLDLTTCSKRTLTPENGERLTSIGFLSTDFVYGRVHSSEIETDELGSEFAPIYALEIINQDLEIQEHYEENCYITSAEIEGNRLSLDRAEKLISESGESYYSAIEGDQIVGALSGGQGTDRIHGRSDEKYGVITEIDAIGLEAGTIRFIRPKETKASAVSLQTEQQTQTEYLIYTAYGFRGAQEIGTDLSEMIQRAGEESGVVTGNGGRIIWSAELKLPKNQIMILSDSENVTQAEGQEGMAECLEQILTFENRGASVLEELRTGRSPAEILEEHLPESTVSNLTGCSLDEILYFVSIEKPVLAIRGNEDPVLVIGYNAEIIVLLDPAAGNVYREDRKSFADMTENAGNRYLAYQ